jgi:uncharacterized membrane protein YkoI
MSKFAGLLVCVSALSVLSCPLARAESAFPEAKVSLEKCLKIAASQKSGDIIKVEYKLVAGAPTYEFEIVTSDGRMWDIEVNTKTGKVVEVEEEVKSAQDPAFKAKSKVSEADAKKTALAAYNGEILETEYEIEPNGGASYEFDIKTAHGEVKVEIDAESGKLVEHGDELYQIGKE